MADFIKVGETQQYRKGRGRVVVVDGVKIAVFWTGTGWFALNDTCPHMGASLADGKLRGQMLTCYWHEWEYDTTTGKCGMRPWACVPLYEVKVEGEDVLLRRPDPPEPPTPPATETDDEWMTWDLERFFKKKEEPKL